MTTTPESRKELPELAGGLDRRIGGREPELLVGIEPKVLGDVEDRLQVSRQSLLPLGRDRLIPPHGPFPTGQPIHRLEIHHRPKAFDVVHGISAV